MMHHNQALSVAGESPLNFLSNFSQYVAARRRCGAAARVQTAAQLTFYSLAPPNEVIWGKSGGAQQQQQQERFGLRVTEAVHNVCWALRTARAHYRLAGGKFILVGDMKLKT
ncbi:hypothetical protein Baya_6847 [Bagarius yarrelli]|uniref:Uncharacterized protein n=1 Tax=Bagarius yarrelli TaxID=175774 RepID=A0A556TYZ2_BAGYA|nr:hypothetical protein Baya_6847 [Bagarius yarrelli]